MRQEPKLNPLRNKEKAGPCCQGVFYLLELKGEQQWALQEYY